MRKSFSWTMPPRRSSCARRAGWSCNNPMSTLMVVMSPIIFESAAVDTS
jgi:hypothetical protein